MATVTPFSAIDTEAAFDQPDTAIAPPDVLTDVIASPTGALSNA